MPNLHQIHFFIFCVNKGFRFMLVYSCLRYRLFKNEKVFCFLRSSVSPASTIKQDCESGVVSLWWTKIPDQNTDLLKCSLITLWIWHPHSPLAPYTSLKRKRRRRNCFKIPTSTGIVVAHVIIANTPSKFFRLHLGTNFLSFDWDVSFSNFFLFWFPFLRCSF